MTKKFRKGIVIIVTILNGGAIVVQVIAPWMSWAALLGVAALAETLALAGLLLPGTHVIMEDEDK
ncbi:MAG: hypothetical protein IT567_05905 [Alphaproteobacteria bacterium]|nr:hypothetical protein [Alphaproteobacteria bacterium]